MFWTGFLIGFALRSGLLRISSTIGVSAQRLLPVFLPHSANGSGGLRGSKATGANFGTYCIISSRL
jgi:hypothetical protein